MIQRSVRGHPLAWRECQVYKRCILHVCWSLWRDFDGVISVACAWFLRLSYVFVTARKSSGYLAACCQNILGFAVDDVLPTVFPVKKCCSDTLQLSFALPHPTACRCSFWGWCAVLSFWWRMRMMRKSANFPNNSSWGLLLRPLNDSTTLDSSSNCVLSNLQFQSMEHPVVNHWAALTSCFTLGAVAFRPINANAAPATTTDASRDALGQLKAWFWPPPKYPEIIWKSCLWSMKNISKP